MDVTCCSALIRLQKYTRVVDDLEYNVSKLTLMLDPWYHAIARPVDQGYVDEIRTVIDAQNLVLHE